MLRTPVCQAHARAHPPGAMIGCPHDTAAHRRPGRCSGARPASSTTSTMGQLWAAFVRSPHRPRPHHGSIDGAAASAAPGVVAVLHRGRSRDRARCARTRCSHQCSTARRSPSTSCASSAIPSRSSSPTRAPTRSTPPSSSTCASSRCAVTIDPVAALDPDAPIAFPAHGTNVAFERDRQRRSRRAARRRHRRARRVREPARRAGAHGARRRARVRRRRHRCAHRVGIDPTRAPGT